MRKRIGPVLAGLTICILFSGCAAFDSTIPELTEEQEREVVEYATETLLKYDRKHGDKVGRQPDDFVIKPTVIVEEPEPTPTPEATPGPEYIEIPESAEPEFEPEDVPGETAYSDLNSAMGNTDGFVSFDYVSYEVVDTYPDSLEAYFVMSATPGNKLIIVKYNAVNSTSEEVAVDVPGTMSPRFKITVNGNTKNALTTLLLNDLAYYKGSLGPGEQEEVVVVGEFSESELTNIESLSLSVKTPEGENRLLTIE